MPAPNISGTTITNAMVQGSWAGGTGLVLTYSIPVGGQTSYWAGYDENDPKYNEPWNGLTALNSTQADAFRVVMELWDEYIVATFNETADDETPGQIRAAFADPNAGEWGYAYLPPTGSNPNTIGVAGDIWISKTQSGFTDGDFTVGTYNFNALMHEAGHALGLGHTFEGGIGAIPAEYDNYRYSIMSYTDITDTYYADFQPDGGGITRHYRDVNPITPMIFDIYAIQSMYGVSTTTRAGTTTYTFDPDQYALQTIFDSSGTDTIDLTGHSRPSYVDLRPGSHSSIDFFSKAAQIEAAVARFGEGYRPFITTQVNQDSTFTWLNNVAIAYSTIIENLNLGNASDTAIGNDAGNYVRGYAGNDTIDGGAGNDTLDGGDGADSMTGGTGNDIFYVNHAGDVVVEGSGGGTLDLVRTSITYTMGANIENLTIIGSGARGASGNSVANTMTGNAADNKLRGFGGNDTLTGGEGNDTLDGGDGADRMTGGIGADHFLGGLGDDLYVIDSASDTMAESSTGGIDTVASGVTHTLGAFFENLIIGGAAPRNGSGNSLANQITGNSGNNTLSGRLGDDTLTGGGGNDTLNGGDGNDVLNGSAGNDAFVFDVAPSATNRDTIVDFNTVNDIIHLNNAVFTAVGADGALAAGAFRIGSAAGDGDDRIIYNSTTGALFYDSNGNAGGGSVQIATLSTGLALTAADFLII